MTECQHQYSGPRLPFWNADRPTLNGLQVLLRPDGSSTNSVLPSLTLSPQPDGSIGVAGWFHMEGSISARLELTMPSLAAFIEFYGEWLACPEVVAVERFGWWPRDREPPHAKSIQPSQEILHNLSLDDIDFDEGA